MSTKYPLDIDKAIGQLGGETQIFYSMLGKFESMSLLASLEEMRDAVNEKDFAKIKNKAHSMKGASGYIGAGGIHYACYHMQEQFLNEQYEEMLSYYPTLIEQSIAFRTYSREAIAKYKSN
jgi:HPt (histidine-containing phosphotransfer) domain-containing protein